MKPRALDVGAVTAGIEKHHVGMRRNVVNEPIEIGAEIQLRLYPLAVSIQHPMLGGCLISAQDPVFPEGVTLIAWKRKIRAKQRDTASPHADRKVHGRMDNTAVCVQLRLADAPADFVKQLST